MNSNLLCGNLRQVFMKSTANKITTRDQLVPVLANLHAMGGKSGFTSGAFDILHAGHVDYLEQARAECDLLVVALNSDASIREYKNPDRPICGEKERAKVIAGLSCVDHVFVFNELNNNQNIEILKPSIYFKAGDYTKDKLSSASLVEAYGGKVKLMPFLKGYSTTSIIERIQQKGILAGVEGQTLATPELRPAVFLDRDGTINESVEYLHEAEKFKLYPGTLEGIKLFQDKGYRVIVVTNQPGIGMGYFSKEDLFSVNKAFLGLASKAGVRVDKIYFCPHSKADGCACRKPGTLMIERAVKELNVDLTRSVMVGDTTIDMQFAKNAGVRGILVRTGQGGKDGLYDVKPDLTADDLLHAATLFLSQS